ncbi:hypothetical protein WKV52_06690 [Tetragenococcus halophilus]|uniref:hypothetical protein n=1 Tax=Tetragenococcus halophilus TaxID=51669 RepID=UPI0030C9A5BD
MEEDRIRHLEMIQGVINRIASHEPQYKGWYVTLIIAINIFSTPNMIRQKVFLVLVITLCFWIITSYYLYIERSYIKLYEDVRQRKVTDFVINIKHYKTVRNFLKGFLSLSHLIYYLVFIFCLCYFMIN